MIVFSCTCNVSVVQFRGFSVLVWSDWHEWTRYWHKVMFGVFSAGEGVLPYQTDRESQLES